MFVTAFFKIVVVEQHYASMLIFFLKIKFTTNACSFPTTTIPRKILIIISAQFTNMCIY